MKMTRVYRMASLVAGIMLLSTAAVADDRTAEEILKDLEKVEFPAYDREKAQDEVWSKDYVARYEAAQDEQAALILELYKVAPEHERAIKLMPKRWSNLIGKVEHRATVRKEVEAIIEAAPTSELALEGRFALAMIAVHEYVWPAEPAVAKALPAVDAFIAAAPGDARGAAFLNWIAGAYDAGSAERMAVYQRIKAEYPNTKEAEYADGKIRQAGAIGKPFELTFTDAITGAEVSMAQLEGQVVVIDFWATWCGPCIGEMPHMKELYAEYHDSGVQFIGVSLDNPEDRGGLTALKDYIAENEIPWPQYYQGNGWGSEFSKSWGINAIPALFIVDKQGNLHSSEARGKLEELIPKLLAE